VATVTIPLDVAVLVRNAFLPLNPRKLRSATPEVKAAAMVFKDAVARAQDAELAALASATPKAVRA
jgi:hypothetical protein